MSGSKPIANGRAARAAAAQSPGGGTGTPLRIASISASLALSRATVARYHGLRSRYVPSPQYLYPLSCLHIHSLPVSHRVMTSLLTYFHDITLPHLLS